MSFSCVLPSYCAVCNRSLFCCAILSTSSAALSESEDTCGSEGDTFDVDAMPLPSSSRARGVCVCVCVRLPFYWSTYFLSVRAVCVQIYLQVLVELVVRQGGLRPGILPLGERGTRRCGRTYMVAIPATFMCTCVMCPCVRACVSYGRDLSPLLLNRTPRRLCSPPLHT